MCGGMAKDEGREGKVEVRGGGGSRTLGARQWRGQGKEKRGFENSVVRLARSSLSFVVFFCFLFPCNVDLCVTFVRRGALF